MYIESALLLFAIATAVLFWANHISNQTQKLHDEITKKLDVRRELDVTDPAGTNKSKRTPYEYIEYQRDLYREAFEMLNDMDYVNDALDYLGTDEGEATYAHYPAMYATLIVARDLLEEQDVDFSTE